MAYTFPTNQEYVDAQDDVVGTRGSLGPHESLTGLEMEQEMLERLNEENPPINYQDQVLEYLRRQEQYRGETVEIEIPKQIEPEDVENEAKVILSEVLKDVDLITSFKEAYEKKKSLNNQSELFDMTDKIKDFHINEKVMEMMTFRDILLVSRVNEDGTSVPVGGICIDVQSATGGKFEKSKKYPDYTEEMMKACADLRRQDLEETTTVLKRNLEEYNKFLEEEMKKDYKKFLVHVSSQLDVDGKNGGSRITAWVDRNLHTLEEKRIEYIQTDPETERERLFEKQLYIFMGKKYFDVRVYPGYDFCQKLCYSFRRARDFLGEAANFILMRYLAIVKFIGTFELAAMRIRGTLCRAIYDCEGPSGGEINNEKLDLYKVYRTIVEEHGTTHRSCTVLTTDGYILKHDWENCDYVLQLNPLSSPSIKRLKISSNLKESWINDLQLLSTYLDKKVASTYYMKSYMADHKEIGDMINDFVQNILQIKPKNIVEFAQHYFLSYAPYLVPRSEYFEEDVNKCFLDDDEY